MLEFLLAASWLLSLLFALTGGMALGYMKAQQDRIAFVNTVKNGVFQLVEKVLNNGKKDPPYFGDSHGPVGIVRPDNAPKDQEQQTIAGDFAAAA